MCAFSVTDLGIAVGSAVSLAADNRMDNRVLFSAGKGAARMGMGRFEAYSAFGALLWAGSLITIGYLFGNVHPSKNMWSIMPEETPYFEVEELYVIPERRSQGIGAALFRFAEGAMPEDVQYVVLSTATKNWRAIFHFYLEELQMEFWSARLFKRIKR